MSALTRLISAIGYPQAVPADAVEFVLRVDDGDVRCLDLEKRLVLMRELTREADELYRLATYSMGRMLREDATLYWDTQREAAVLAQEISVTASEHELRVFFETFIDACDWWLARIVAEPMDSTSFPEMVIRP
jgi:hypothetical protein